MTSVTARKLMSLHLLANQHAPLHGMRVLAILMVLQFHVWSSLIRIYGKDNPLFQSGTSLWFGMDLFFIMSGFLIGTMLLLSVERNGSVSIGNFYLRRSFRIIPLYYVVLTFFVLISNDIPYDGKYLWAEYLYLTNYLDWDQQLMRWGWSLAVEEHFYLAVPLLIILLHRVSSVQTQLLILTVGWASCLFVRWYLWETHPEAWSDSRAWGDLVYRPTHTRYDTLLAGIWLAIFQQQYGATMSAVLMRSAGLRLLLLAFPVVAFGTIILNHGSWRDPTLFRTLALGTITSLGWVPLIIYLLNVDGAMSRFFGHHWFRNIATLGYGVYLVHIIVLRKVANPLGNRLLTGEEDVMIYGSFLLAITVLGSLVVAYLLHIVVEKPALHLRDRIA